MVIKNKKEPEHFSEKERYMKGFIKKAL